MLNPLRCGSRPAARRKPGLRSPVSVAAATLLVAVLTASCSAPGQDPEAGGGPSSSATGGSTPSRPQQLGGASPGAGRSYPWHTAIVATTFWVGEIFDPNAEDGSQMYSTYDSSWAAHYGGCDGVVSDQGCDTEKRLPPDYFPEHMTPRENPFYLDLPFDDLNNPTAFGQRCDVVPWASDPGYVGHCDDRDFSYMKNRWVRLKGAAGQTCYGQIEDAGPGQYHDARYVFGAGDSRPANQRYGGAGMDVSPALNGCLGMKELNGSTDMLSWQFVEAVDVPSGPWTKIVTTAGVFNQ